MGRLVQPARVESVVLGGGGGFESANERAVLSVGGDRYPDRVAKYIPGEVIAGYMSLDRLLPQVGGSTQTPESILVPIAPYLPLAILLIGLVLTPLYIRQVSLSSDACGHWQTQAVISTLAFLVWAYAIHGSAFDATWSGATLYDGTLASILLILFTLISGLFGPPPIMADSAGRR